MLSAVLAVKLWNVWCLVGLLVDWIPVNAWEPRVCHDLFSVTGTRAKTRFRILIKQLLAEISSFWTQKWKVKLWLAMLDVMEKLLFIFVIEWWLSTKHFVDNSSKWPPVCGFSMPLSLNNFRCKIFCSSTDTLCLSMSNYIFLWKPKVCYLCVSISCHQHIFRLEISVENVLRMQVMQCQQDITCVESGSIFLEPSNLRKIEKEFSTWAVFQHKEQFTLTLEGIVHFDNEWMLYIFQDSPFSHSMFNLVPPYDLSLLQYLHSI